MCGNHSKTLGAVPMYRVEKSELIATLQQLDQAIHNHDLWLKEVNRTVICQLPYNECDVEKDAHRHCLFGQWYYDESNRSEALNSHPAFVAIEVAHRRMHEVGAQLLIAMEDEGENCTKNFDSFSHSLDMLHLEIFSLKKDLEEQLYNRDALTGAENRISMLTRLRELHEFVKRDVQKCSIVLMDLDHFKRVNDIYGHPAGDQVLVAWVHYIKQNLRTYDSVYRYGGEEFLISFPNTTLQDVQDIVQRIRNGFTKVAIGEDESIEITVTASFGITALDPNVSIEETINRVDTALYAAKAAGRNQACVWDDSMPLVRDGGGSVVIKTQSTKRTVR